MPEGEPDSGVQNEAVQSGGRYAEVDDLVLLEPKVRTRKRAEEWRRMSGYDVGKALGPAPVDAEVHTRRMPGEPLAGSSERWAQGEPDQGEESLSCFEYHAAHRHQRGLSHAQLRGLRLARQSSHEALDEACHGPPIKNEWLLGQDSNLQHPD